MAEYGWGIIGPGKIVRRMMTALPHVPNAKLAAIGSRDPAKAAAFAKEYGFAKSYGTYAECIKDPNVDIVYVALPHPFHVPVSLEALEAGKAVLCEKPVAVNTAEIRRLADFARKKKVFFMEAMWTRFFPVNREIKSIINSGRAGIVTFISAELCFGNWKNLNSPDPHSRLYAPVMAGGSLLDIGIYPLSYCDYMKNGMVPSKIKAIATMTSTGVDGMTAGIFQYPDGSISMQRSSIIHSSGSRAVICCEKCTIDVPDFQHPTRATIAWKDTSTNDTIEIPLVHGIGEGFYYECEEVMRCLDAGLKESPLMTLDDSIRIMEQMDTVRREIGLKYPME